MVPRLFMMGVCAAVVVLLVSFEPLRVVEVVELTVACEPGPAVTIVDVAHGVAPDQLAPLLQMRPGEWLSAINEHPLASEFDADAWITELAPKAGDYLDVTVTSTTGARRVLVLLH